MLSRIYQVETDDPTVLPNPARKAAVKEVHGCTVHLRKLRESYGTTAIDYIIGQSTDPGFAIAEEKFVWRLTGHKHIKKLQARRVFRPRDRCDAQGARDGETSIERNH